MDDNHPQVTNDQQSYDKTTQNNDSSDITLPLVINGVHVFFNEEIPEKPFITKKFQIKLDFEGIYILDKMFYWPKIKQITIKYYLGNPYIYIAYPGDPICLWFTTSWYRLHKYPWYGTSQYLTETFLEILKERVPDKLCEIPAENEMPNTKISGMARFYHTLINFGLFALPTTFFLILFGFIVWVLFFAPVAETQF